MASLGLLAHEIHASYRRRCFPIQLPYPSYDIALHGHGILGQKGFFDIFTVKFDLGKEEIELKEIRK